MRQILTHTSRNVEDVINILKSGGTFTCPTLPHYRYDGTKKSRSVLMKSGMLRETGKTNTGVSYVASNKFNEWLAEFNAGKTKLMPVKWAKLKRQEGEQK
jgi:hypothetical protein